MTPRFALGFGNNVDYEIVWDAPALERLALAYGVRTAELDVDRAITTERDLVVSILSFVQAGVGGERIVASSELLEHFAGNFAKRITLGGTSVRAAIAMRTFGLTSALHLVTINDHVRRLLPADCPYVCSNTRDTLYPHLIVQFAAGSRVRAGDIDIRAGRANRIIYHRDEDNIAMRIDEGFADLAADAKVFLIAGFNAMRDERLLETRLASVARIMRALPAGARVFYEDAGFSRPNFRHTVARFLAGRADIVSLNEDELQAYLGRKLDVLQAEQMAAALTELRRVISAPVVVVHGHHWALAYGRNVAGLPEIAAALEGGVTMATARFCYGDNVSEREYHEIASRPPNQAGAVFAGAITKLLGQEICCVPVAEVAPAQATTVGLGDAFVGGFLAALAARA